jgi:hypothetical protein
MVINVRVPEKETRNFLTSEITFSSSMKTMMYGGRNYFLLAMI